MTLEEVGHELTGVEARHNVLNVIDLKQECYLYLFECYLGESDSEIILLACLT